MTNSVDPLTLLKAISTFLNANGGVAGPGEMQSIVKLMKDESRLVSRCVYLNILRVTDKNEILEKFVGEGGWTILNSWLVEAKSSENMSLILEILNFLQQLPLRINHLKQNNTPKLVKSFVKNASCSKVKAVAATLMTHWLGIIKDASVPSDSNKKKVKSKPETKSEVSKKVTTKPPPISKAPSFAKFRKTGLENNSESSKKSGKFEKGVAVKRSSIDNESSGSLPDKKPKSEPKPQKKIAISSDFMEAISSVPTNRRPIKRKPTNKPKVLPSLTNSDKLSPSHNPQYISGEAGDFTGSPVRTKTPSPVPSPTEPSKPKLNKYGKPMKSVRWVTEDRLESIRYFEKEEGERVNVTTQSFKDALRRDRISERQKLGDFHHQGEGHWRTPRRIDLPPPLVEIGFNSVEKQIQEEREKSVLQEIFLSLDMVPDTPTEPDPEPYELIPPKVIPIEDPNDPGPLCSRSPSPIVEPESDYANSVPKLQEENPDLLNDKLREIIQTATANTNCTSPVDEPSPTTPQEMFYPPMMNNNDPNAMYPGPPRMMLDPNNFYTPDPNMPMGGHQPPPHLHPQGMMGPSPMLPQNDHYGPGWGPPHMGQPGPPFMDLPHLGGSRRPPPPPHFQQGFRGNPWRPQNSWRGERPMPERWPMEERGRFGP